MTTGTATPPNKKGQGWLVLSRRPGEEIILTLEDGRQITVMVSEFYYSQKGRTVRLAIKAPPSVRINRGDGTIDKAAGADGDQHPPKD